MELVFCALSAVVLFIYSSTTFLNSAIDKFYWTRNMLMQHEHSPNLIGYFMTWKYYLVIGKLLVGIFGLTIMFSLTIGLPGYVRMTESTLLKFAFAAIMCSSILELIYIRTNRRICRKISVYSFGLMYLFVAAFFFANARDLETALSAFKISIGLGFFLCALTTAVGIFYGGFQVLNGIYFVLLGFSLVILGLYDDLNIEESTDLRGRPVSGGQTVVWFYLFWFVGFVALLKAIVKRAQAPPPTLEPNFNVIYTHEHPDILNGLPTTSV